MASPTYLIRDDDGSILRFDAVISVSRSPSVKVSEHPLETGASVVDHTQREPDRLSVLAVISESPLAPATVGGVRRIQEALDWLDASVGRTLRLVSRVRSSGDLLLTGWPYEVTTRRSIRVSLALREVRFAEVETVIVSVDDVTRSTSDGTSGDEALDETTSTELPDLTEAAEQATTDTSDEAAQETENTSTLADLLGALGA